MQKRHTMAALIVERRSVCPQLAGHQGTVARRAPAAFLWRAWLFTTARRRAIDEARRRSRRPEKAIEETLPAWLPVSPDAADLALEQIGTRSALSLVARLPPHQAEVILLRVVAGLDNQTVARMLGRSPGAVKVAAHRGLRTMAAILADADVTL